ncbi:MAG: polymer-forming cytoskeletal protein, partial [Deltaproteobacteria bacterium]|nr:polymer-forming cytoskeletal protein [Deltaproteobacteria bacterium]
LGRDFSYSAATIGTLGANQNYTVTVRYLTESNPEGFCDSNAVPDNIGVGSAVPPTTLNCGPAEIVMYGQDFNLNSTVTQIKYGMLPTYRLVSTGTSNGTSRTIEAYLGESNLNTETDKAINSNSCIAVNGGSNTVTGSVVQAPGCGCDPMLSGGCSPNKAATTDMTTYLGDTLANIATYADEVHSCTNANCSAPGNDIPSSGQLDGVVTNWGSVTDQEGTLLFIDNSGGKPVSITGGVPDGEGILIVTGDLTISGNVKWEGLIYVMGTLTISGTINVEGGIMANNTVTLNGTVTVKYDQEELLEMARQTSTSATMLWKRL